MKRRATVGRNCERTQSLTLRPKPRLWNVLEAVQYASEDIRNDPVVTLPVVQSCWWAGILSSDI